MKPDFSDIEDPNELLRKKNEKELDELCKKCCLCFGWIFVVLFTIYVIVLLAKGP